MLLTKIFLSSILLASSALAFTSEVSSSIEENNCKESFVTISQGKLFCKSYGQGDPILVVHGGPGLSQEYLLPYLSDLSKSNKVIFYDQRGCGKSEGPVDAGSIQFSSYIEDIEAIRKAFGFEKISLLGHSWGGHLAMAYAAAHPESTSKLILMNSMGATSGDFAAFIKSWLNKMSSVLPVLNKMEESEAYRAGDPETVSRYLKVMFGPYCFSPQNVERLNLKMSSKASLNGNLSYKILRDSYLTKSFDLTPSLKKLSCKTLIIHGDSDIIPVQSAKNIQSAIPGSKLVVLEKCGHFAYMEKSETTLSFVDSFLHQP